MKKIQATHVYELPGADGGILRVKAAGGVVRLEMDYVGTVNGIALDGPTWAALIALGPELRPARPRRKRVASVANVFGDHKEKAV